MWYKEVNVKRNICSIELREIKLMIFVIYLRLWKIKNKVNFEIVYRKIVKSEKLEMK